MFQNYASNVINEWVDPSIVAANIDKKHEKFTFLFSASNRDNLGRNSYIAFDVLDEVKGEDIEDLELLDDDQWFGYYSYDLKNSLENLPIEENSYIKTACFWLIKYKNVIVFDHLERKIIYYYTDNFNLDIFEHTKLPENASGISYLKSNMDKEYYLSSIRKIKQLINEGILYQANMTRKYFGEFIDKPNALGLFLKLMNISGTDYSCFFKYGDMQIISSSPEQFLLIDEDKNVQSKPIKGTLRRSQDSKEDEDLKLQLYNSPKDRSENLMIVDLMRNDFAKNCIPGSVRVEDLFKVETYTKLYHMVTKILGKIKPEISNLDFLKGCFPPGSMTGAPKIQAMIECTKLEKWYRGIYSGCVGRFSKNKSVDLSVVIRTLVVENKKFEFQVGGGIVAKSDPDLELNEILLKASGIALALGINIDNIRDI